MEPYALNSTLFMAGKLTEFRFMQCEPDGLFPAQHKCEDHTEPNPPQVDKAINPNGYVRINYTNRPRKSSVEDSLDVSEAAGKDLKKKKPAGKSTLSIASLYPHKR
jgi:hypothetical protein